MKKFILSVFAFSLLLLGCSKSSDTPAPVAAPTVDFSYSGVGPAPTLVTFSNMSTNATSYSWDFGDNSYSSDANPQHGYLTSGVYTVKLTATNSTSSVSTTKTINISAAYTKVTVTKITITQMPFTKPSGAGWDPTSGPDVFVNISDSVSVVKYNGSANVFSNATSSSLPIWFNTVPNYVNNNNFYVARYVDVWDDDSPLANDYIGFIYFRLADYITLPNPYPSSINISNSTTGISATLDLIWQ